MEKKIFLDEEKCSIVAKMLAALAHETRLRVFKILVEIGAEGSCPCHIAEALQIARNTLSFHLNILAQADLVSIRRDGKFLFYSPNLDNLHLLTDYLWSDMDVLQGFCPKAHEHLKGRKNV